MPDETALGVLPAAAANSYANLGSKLPALHQNDVYSLIDRGETGHINNSSVSM